jgi:aspartate carbamoyltransferase
MTCGHPRVPQGQSILSVSQYGRTAVEDLFDAIDRQDWGDCTGKIIANLFYEPSTRTSSSFHAAMLKLGGNVIPINEVTYSSVSKGESLEDTIRTLGCYVDAIVLRHPDEDAALTAHKVSSVPIVNAGCGSGEHPTQALLDLYTIYKENHTIDGLTVTLMGDLKYGRTVHSLVQLLGYFNVKIQFISPPDLRIPAKYAGMGTLVELDDVISTTDVLYMTRVQKERHTDPDPLKVDYAAKYALALGYDNHAYRITEEHMVRAKRGFALMHPLPRLSEIPKEIDSDPRAAYFRQVRYGLDVRMALLSRVLRVCR